MFTQRMAPRIVMEEPIKLLERALCRFYEMYILDYINPNELEVEVVVVKESRGSRSKSQVGGAGGVGGYLLRLLKRGTPIAPDIAIQAARPKTIKIAWSENPVFVDIPHEKAIDPVVIHGLQFPAEAVVEPGKILEIIAMRAVLKTVSKRFKQNVDTLERDYDEIPYQEFAAATGLDTFIPKIPELINKFRDIGITETRSITQGSYALSVQQENEVTAVEERTAKNIAILEQLQTEKDIGSVMKLVMDLRNINPLIRDLKRDVFDTNKNPYYRAYYTKVIKQLSTFMKDVFEYSKLLIDKLVSLVSKERQKELRKLVQTYDSFYMVITNFATVEHTEGRYKGMIFVPIMVLTPMIDSDMYRYGMYFHNYFMRQGTSKRTCGIFQTQQRDNTGYDIRTGNINAILTQLFSLKSSDTRAVRYDLSNTVVEFIPALTEITRSDISRDILDNDEAVFDYIVRHYSENAKKCFNFVGYIRMRELRETLEKTIEEFNESFIESINHAMRELTAVLRAT